MMMRLFPASQVRLEQSSPVPPALAFPQLRGYQPGISGKGVTTVPRPEPLRARPRQARLKRQAGGRAGRVGGKRRGRERAGKDAKPAPPGRTGRLPAPAEWPGAPRLLPRGGARTGRGAHVARSGRRVGVRGSSWDKALGEPGLRGTRRRRPVFRRERRGSQGLTGPRPWVEDAVVNTGPGPLIPPL